MKGIGRQQRSQTLIVVLILLFLGTIIGTGLMRMWETEVRTNSVSDDGRLALYLAQAAVERGKYELKQNWGYNGTATPVNMGAGSYNIGITGGGSTKTVIGTGRVREATRQLQVVLDSTTTPGPCLPNCTNVTYNSPNCAQCDGEWCWPTRFYLGSCSRTWVFDYPGNDFHFHLCILWFCIHMDAVDGHITITLDGFCIDKQCVCKTCIWNDTQCGPCTPTIATTEVEVHPESWEVQ